MKSTADGVSRRRFTLAGIAGIGTATAMKAADDKVITSASVPDDPDAPKVQKGTQPDVPPFGDTLSFKAEKLSIKARPFPMTQVRIISGDFLTAQEANRTYLHELPVDRLVYNFRRNAGLPSSAEPLGGWEKPDCELRGHFVGHYLSACALMYSTTGDGQLKANSEEVVSEFAKCQQQLSGGYLSAFPSSFFDRLRNRTPVWAPFYTIHKIMAGLLDVNLHTGNAQALEVVSRMADWVDTWTRDLSEPQMQMVLDTEYGGMNDVLYSLGTVTGNVKFCSVGDRFTKRRFFNPLAVRRDELRGLHANTHIPQVIGAARRYEISSDPRFGDVARYFWDEIASARTYANGGTSNNEGWLTQPYHLAEELAQGVDTNECCCVYNMLKLTRHLYTWSADPRYFDLYERILYNHRLGTIDPETGMTQYYLGIRPASWRTFGTKYDTFWCCNGTGVEEYSKLNDSIYFHDDAGLYVNLFIPSKLDWTERGIQIEQKTRFPQDEVSRLEIRLKKPATFAIRIRIPGWVASDPMLKLNGTEVPITASPGSYVSLRRVWNDNDAIEIRLPMEVRYESLPDSRQTRAVLYGPILLAGQLPAPAVPPQLIDGKMGPKISDAPSPPIPSFKRSSMTADALIRRTGEDLTFDMTDGRSRTQLRPFHRIREGRYSVYWQIA